MKISYISETSLTNRSAQSIHVVKMCDAFSKKHKLTLLLPKNNIKFTKIKKEFMLTSKNKFIIRPLLNKKINNFFYRLYFGYKVSKFLLDNDQDLIITRSFVSSFFLSMRKIKHILEIHSEFRGLTKLIMVNLNFINSIYIKKVIFISNALKKKFIILKKSKSIILHDAVDIENFSSIKVSKNKTIKNLAYVGSFHEGKGVELVCELAAKFKNLNFNIFGDSLGKYYPKLFNLKFHGYIKYNKVPQKLYSSDILLLPSAKIQFGRSNSVNISNYNSPLKMFDYLAAGKIIISSKLDGICEVLKHEFNSIITEGFEINDWENSINAILKNKYDLNHIRQNAIKTAKNYTWEKRVNTITNLHYK